MAWPFDQEPVSPQTTAPSLAGLLGLIATNPHGWGNAPPAPQPQQSQQPELRSHDPSLGRPTIAGEL